MNNALEHLATYQLPLAGVWLQQLPWMVSFLRRFCNECVAWNLLCIAGCGHCSDLDWIISQKIWKLALPVLLINKKSYFRPRNMYITEHAATNMSLIMCFRVWWQKSDFSRRGMLQGSLQGSFGNTACLCGPGSCCLAADARSMIHSPKVFFKFADVRYSYFWYMICYSDEFDVSLATQH